MILGSAVLLITQFTDSIADQTQFRGNKLNESNTLKM